MIAPRLRAALAGLVLAGALVTGLGLVATTPAATAQDAPGPADTPGLPDLAAPREADPVLAIVSPVVNPVCELSGSATLLVPVLSGLLSDNLDLGDTVSLGDVILDALGPVYMVCGSLPASPNSTCELDRQIASALPEEVTSLGLPPTLLGDLADLLDALLDLLGLVDLGLSVAPVLQCTIREAPGAAEPPALPPAPASPAPPAGPSAPSTPGPVAPAPSVGVPPAMPALEQPAIQPARPAAPAQPQPQPVATVSSVADAIRRVVPGWLQVIQILLAAALVAFLGMSWATSARLRRQA